MAEQDFRIKIVTTADTSGIRQTSSAIDDLKRKAATPAAVPVATPQIGQLTSQLVGAATAFGTGLVGALAVVGPALAAIYQGFNKLNADMDKWAEGVLRTAEKVHEMQQAFADSTEWAEKLRIIGMAPLGEQITKLHSELTRLKTEQGLVNQSTEDGVKEAVKYQHQIDQVAGRLRALNTEQERQRAQAEKDRTKAQEKASDAEKSFLEGAYSSADEQTKRIIINEQAAKQARAAGDDRSADLFQKSADAFRRGATPEQNDAATQIEKGFDAAADKIIGYMQGIWGR